MNILIGVSVVCIFVLLLCIFIDISNRLLEEKGEANVCINNEKSFRIKKGEKLLSALSKNGVYLPAACGGKGNCGKCKIKILSGKSILNSLEKAILTKEDQLDNFHLACQLKLREDLNISIPKDYLLIGCYKARLVETESLAYQIKKLEFVIENEEKLEFKAGQYIQILKKNLGEDTIRAYSISSSPVSNQKFTLDVQLVENGIMSNYLHNLNKDEIIEFCGPFGDMYIDEGMIKESDKKFILLIAGGVGLAPIRAISKYLLDIGFVGKIALFHGARSKKYLYNQDEFINLSKENSSFEYVPVLAEPALEDGWTGKTGLVTAILDEWVNNRTIDLSNVEAYICGPSLMIESTKESLEKLGIDSNNIHYDPF